MEIIVLRQAQKELKRAPRSVIEDIFALFEDLAAGKQLGFPISRPLPAIAKGLHELRLSYEDGEYRVFYVIRVRNAIYVIHAAQKKKQGIDRKTTDLLHARIRGFNL